MPVRARRATRVFGMLLASCGPLTRRHKTCCCPSQPFDHKAGLREGVPHCEESSGWNCPLTSPGGRGESGRNCN